MFFNPCFDFAYKWRQHALLRNASRMPRTPGAFVGNSSMKSHRRFKALRKSWSMSWSSPLLVILSSALEALIGIWPQECNVLPPIKAAIVFMQATNWNSTPCCQCRHSWKKRRQRWMHVLFPAPGIPSKQNNAGLSEHCVPPPFKNCACSLRHRSMTACRNTLCSSVGGCVLFLSCVNHNQPADRRL